jgi:hypothetical protein
MHPFRIAILIFLVGASGANYFVMKQYDDRIVAMMTAVSFFGGTPTALPGSDVQEQMKLAEANDKAWLREAVILTIAGIAWFLVRPQAS